MYNSQKHVLEMIKLPYAWAQTVGSKQVLVGVVDSGIDFDHPDCKTIFIKTMQNTKLMALMTMVTAILMIIRVGTLLMHQIWMESELSRS